METSLRLYRFKIITKDESSDPFRLTGSWAVARDRGEARERIATYGGWMPGSEGWKLLSTKYDVVQVGPAFERFEGTREEWIESIRRGIIASSDLYFFVPEALTPLRRAFNRPPRPLRPKVRLAERIENRLRTIVRYRHTILWLAGLLGVALLTVGWVFFQEQLEATLGSTVTVGVFAYLVWRFVFRRRY